MKLPFHERLRQAQLYAQQVRVRKAMGAQYAHAPRTPDGKVKDWSTGWAEFKRQCNVA